MAEADGDRKPDPRSTARAWTVARLAEAAAGLVLAVVAKLVQIWLFFTMVSLGYMAVRYLS